MAGPASSCESPIFATFSPTGLTYSTIRSETLAPDPPPPPTKVFRHSTRHTSNYFFLPLPGQLCRYHDYEILFILLLAIHISNAPPPSVQFREGEFATPSPAFVAFNFSDLHPFSELSDQPYSARGGRKEEGKEKKEHSRN